MAKGEISWKRRTEEGEKIQVYAHKTGSVWSFFSRPGRFEQWLPLESPPKEDWLELLDGVQRRVARRLMRPEEVDHLEKLIEEKFD
jgi:hypothetical protein